MRGKNGGSPFAHPRQCKVIPTHVESAYWSCFVTALLPAAASGSALTAERITQLRRTIFVDGGVDAREIEQLFTILHAHGDEGPADWPVLFVDAVKIYLVEQ